MWAAAADKSKVHLARFTRTRVKMGLCQQQYIQLIGDGICRQLGKTGTITHQQTPHIK